MVIVHRDIERGHHIQQVVARVFEYATRLVVCLEVQVPVGVSTGCDRCVSVTPRSHLHCNVPRVELSEQVEVLTRDH